MDEDLEQRIAELVAGLTPAEYQRRGPALRELGLALAEARQLDREIEKFQERYERIMEDQARTTERVRSALRLWEDGL